MENKNLKKIYNIFKKIIIWIFSNLMWTIICYIVPFALIIPFAHSLLSKEVYFSLFEVLLIIVFFVIEQVILILNIIVKKKNISKKGTNSINSNNTKDELKTQENPSEKSLETLDYYFEEYNKHLTVYKDGHGILIDSFTLVINDIDSIQKFKRLIDINDGQINTSLPKLSVMKRTDIKDRFKKYGFWCKCCNDNKLIHSVEEKYWSENDDEIDEVSQNDPKVLKWIFRINISSIKIGFPYKIVYVISLPKMFPINNGRFSEEIANHKMTHGKYKTEFSSKHIIKKFSQTISFENRFDLKNIPNGKILKYGNTKNLHFVNDNNIIYDKYIFTANNIGENDIIEIEWSFKE